MKIANYQIDSYIAKISSEKIAGALIYGPEISVITSRFNAVAKKIVADLSDQFLVAHLNKERFNQQESCLADEFYSFSMLGGRKLIIIKDCDVQAASALKDLLNNPAEVAKSDNFILIQAGDLDKSSALRKIAENHNLFASIACYEDDEKTIKKFIEQQLARNSLNSGFEIVQYLYEKIGKNRQIIASEINKIAIYLDKKEITIEAIDLVIQGQAEIPFDSLVDNFVAKNSKEVVKSCDHLFKNGFDAIMMIRFLSNYLQKLYNAKSATELAGIDFEESVKAQKLFFKSEIQFRKHLKQTELKSLVSWLGAIQNLEIDLKTKSGVSPKTIFLMFLQNNLKK